MAKGEEEDSEENERTKNGVRGTERYQFERGGERGKSAREAIEGDMMSRSTKSLARNPPVSHLTTKRIGTEVATEPVQTCLPSKWLKTRSKTLSPALWQQDSRKRSLTEHIVKLLGRSIFRFWKAEIRVDDDQNIDTSGYPSCLAPKIGFICVDEIRRGKIGRYQPSSRQTCTERHRLGAMWQD